MQPPSPYRQLAHSLDPVLFAKEALGFEADPWQETLLRTTAPQVVLNNSRQSGKSTASAIRALHTGVFKPGSLILLISPSLRQSKELLGKVTSFLKALQPVQVLEEDSRSASAAASAVDPPLDQARRVAGLEPLQRGQQRRRHQRIPESRRSQGHADCLAYSPIICMIHEIGRYAR